MRRVGRDAEGAEGGEGMRGVQRGSWLRTIFMHVVAATSSTIVTASTSPAGSLASACHCYAIVHAAYMQYIRNSSRPHQRLTLSGGNAAPSLLPSAGSQPARTNACPRHGGLGRALWCRPGWRRFSTASAPRPVELAPRSPSRRRHRAARGAGSRCGSVRVARARCASERLAAASMCEVVSPRSGEVHTRRWPPRPRNRHGGGAPHRSPRWGGLSPGVAPPVHDRSRG